VAVAAGAPRAALPAQSRCLHAPRMHKGHRIRPCVLRRPGTTLVRLLRSPSPAQRREHGASTHTLRAAQDAQRVHSVQDAQRAHAWGGVAGVDLELASADTLQPARYATWDRLLAQARTHAAHSIPHQAHSRAASRPQVSSSRMHGREAARQGRAVLKQGN